MIDRPPQRQQQRLPQGGWRAHINLRFVLDDRAARTRLAACEHSGPLTVQRTFHVPKDPACHVYVLHPPGGIVGGDRLDTQVHVESGAYALITTPAATKWYRTASDSASSVQQLHVKPGAVLEWLPQENILFDGALAASCTTVHLEPQARFIGWEIVSLGRAAASESFQNGAADFRLAVSCDERLVLMDRLRLRGRDPLLTSAAGLRGHTAAGTLIAAPADAHLCGLVRERIGSGEAVDVAFTCVDGVLVGRALAAEGRLVQRCFTRIWQVLRPALVGAGAIEPRIWAT